MDEAAKIAIGTAKNFVVDHPDELDVIKWVLFDDETFEVYEKELEQWKVSEIVHSPSFDAINYMLRNGRM